MNELWTYPHELSLGDYISIVSGSGTLDPVYKVIQCGEEVMIQSMTGRRHSFFLYASIGVVRLNSEEALARILKNKV